MIVLIIIPLKQTFACFIYEPNDDMYTIEISEIYLHKQVRHIA